MVLAVRVDTSSREVRGRCGFLQLRETRKSRAWLAEETDPSTRPRHDSCSGAYDRTTRAAACVPPHCPIPKMAIQLSHIVLVLALAAGAYLLLGRRSSSTASSLDSKPANGSANGSGLKGANSGTTAGFDTGRDFVAALQQAVSTLWTNLGHRFVTLRDILRSGAPRTLDRRA